MQLKSGSAASKGGGASRKAFSVGDWERDNETARSRLALP